MIEQIESVPPWKAENRQSAICWQCDGRGVVLADGQPKACIRGDGYCCPACGGTGRVEK